METVTVLDSAGIVAVDTKPAPFHTRVIERSDFGAGSAVSVNDTG